MYGGVRGLRYGDIFVSFPTRLACIEKQKKNILARRLKEDYLYNLNRIRGILFFLLIETSDLIISKTVNELINGFALTGCNKFLHKLCGAKSIALKC